MISASEASSSSGPEPGWEARVVEASRPIKAPASSDMPSIMATFTSETLEDTVRRTLMVHDLPLMYRDCNLVVVMVQGTMEKLLSRLEGQGSGESATSALEYIDQCEAQNTPYLRMQPRQELEAADAKASEEHAVDEPSAADRILCWATVLREQTPPTDLVVITRDVGFRDRVQASIGTACRYEDLGRLLEEKGRTLPESVRANFEAMKQGQEAMVARARELWSKSAQRLAETYAQPAQAQ